MTIYQSLKDYVFPSANQLLIDIRSLSHFQHGSIPNAVHLPLMLKPNARQTFTNQYPTLSSPHSFFENYPSVLQKVKQFQEKHKQLIFFCEDGSWKSRLVHTFFKKEIADCQILHKGYAGFIDDLSSFFSEDRFYYLLIGKTGSRKTKVLQALQQNGEQVLDLEALSGHKGSVFGNNKNGLQQPSSPQFHNRILDTLLKTGTDYKIYVESKGRLIGRCTIPSELLDQFSKAKKILLDVPKQQRVKNILEDYQTLDTKYVHKALEKIKVRLGPNLYLQCQNALLAKDQEALVEHLLTYYDSVANYQYFNQKIALQIKYKNQSFLEIAEYIRKNV